MYSNANFYSNAFVYGTLTACNFISYSNNIQQTTVQVVGSNMTFSNIITFDSNVNLYGPVTVYTEPTFCNGIQVYQHFTDQFQLAIIS